MGIVFGPNELVLGAVLLAVLFLVFVVFGKNKKRRDAPDTEVGTVETVKVDTVENESTDTQLK